MQYHIGITQPRQTGEVVVGVSAHSSTGTSTVYKGTRAANSTPFRMPQALKGNRTRVRHHSAHSCAPHRLASGSTASPFQRRTGWWGGTLKGGVGGIQMSNSTSFPGPWQLVVPAQDKVTSTCTLLDPPVRASHPGCLVASPRPARPARELGNYNASSISNAGKRPFVGWDGLDPSGLRLSQNRSVTH